MYRKRQSWLHRGLLDASQSGCQGHGEEGWLRFPDWHWPKHQLGWWGETHWATYTWPLDMYRDVQQRDSHMHTLCWEKNPKQLQHISVNVINIKTKVQEFRKQEWQIWRQN